MRRNWKALCLALLAVAAALLIAFVPAAETFAAGRADGAAAQTLVARSKKKATPTPRQTATPTPAPSPAATPAGPIIDPQAIADYLFANGCLPDNFITKEEAQDLGWDSYVNDVSDVAPGKSIGGDRFGNYENRLPKARGRQYYECDCYYVSGPRSAYRLIYSSDGLVYYTADHYRTFTQLFPSPTATP